MRRIWALCFLSLIALAGCGSASDGGAPMSRSSEVAPSEAPASPQRAASAPLGGGGGGADVVKPVSLEEANSAQTAAEAFNRKIIRNAELAIQVDDPADAQRKISAIAEQQGGFVVTSEISQYGSSGPSVSITMRVPADHFGQAMEALHAVGSKVLSEKTTGQDVTEEYIDLEARIRTKQALEAQFLEILKQAKSVSDALQVQREIADVRGEIEQLEGRRRFLENQSSLSTIKVALQTPAAVVTTTGSSFGDHIKRAFGDSIDTASAIVIGFIRLLGVLIPIVVLIVLPAYFLIRFLWRRMQRKRAQRAAEAPAQAPPPFPGAA